jgi:hypothetical protein
LTQPSGSSQKLARGLLPVAWHVPHDSLWNACMYLVAVLQALRVHASLATAPASDAAALLGLRPICTAGWANLVLRLISSFARLTITDHSHCRTPTMPPVGVKGAPGLLQSLR